MSNGMDETIGVMEQMTKSNNDELSKFCLFRKKF